MDHWDWPPHVPDVTMAGREGKAVDKNLLYQCSRFEIHQLISGSRIEGDSTELLSVIATNDDGAVPQSGVLSCAVVVGQDKFFLVPAHIFMPPPTDDPEEDFDDDSDDSESDGGSEMLRAGSATPPTEHLADSDYTTDDMTQISPTMSPDIPQSGVEEPSSTQLLPATDDFSVFASELDYALIRIPHEEKFHEKLRYLSPKAVQHIDTGLFAISATTPSCGLVKGWLDGRPTMMRLPYSSRFTDLYPVSFPCAVSKGDCGSVVIDQDSNKIYGFIVAASVEGRVAYMVSADEILQDMSIKLGKEVSADEIHQGMSIKQGREVSDQQHPSGVIAFMTDYLAPLSALLSIGERTAVASSTTDRPSSAVSVQTVSVPNQPPSTTSENTVSVSSTIDQPPSTMSEHTLLGEVPQSKTETEVLASPIAQRRSSIVSEQTLLASHGGTTLVPSAADAMSVRGVGAALQYNLGEVLLKDASIEKQAMVSEWAESTLKAPWQANEDLLRSLESASDVERRLEAKVRSISQEGMQLKKANAELEKKNVRLQRENAGLRENTRGRHHQQPAAETTRQAELDFRIPIHRLENEIMALTARMRDDGPEKTAIEEEFRRLVKITENLRNENEGLKNRVSDFGRINNLLRATDASFRNDVSELTRQIVEWRRRYEDAGRRLNQFRENLDHQVMENSELRRENDRLRERERVRRMEPRVFIGPPT